MTSSADTVGSDDPTYAAGFFPLPGTRVVFVHLSK